MRWDRAKINSCFTALKLSPNFCYRWRGVSEAHTPQWVCKEPATKLAAKRASRKVCSYFCPVPVLLGTAPGEVLNVNKKKGRGRSKEEATIRCRKDTNLRGRAFILKALLFGRDWPAPSNIITTRQGPSQGGGDFFWRTPRTPMMINPTEDPRYRPTLMPNEPAAKIGLTGPVT